MLSNQTEARSGGFDQASKTRGLGELVAVDGMLSGLFTLFWGFNFFAQVCHHLHCHHILTLTLVAAVILFYLFFLLLTNSIPSAPTG